MQPDQARLLTDNDALSDAELGHVGAFQPGARDERFGQHGEQQQEDQHDDNQRKQISETGGGEL